MSLLHDGRVLVVGGQSEDETLASAELYDPTTRTWTMTEPMYSERHSHFAVVLLNGTVLVVGGDVGDTDCQIGAELYDPESGNWSVVDSLDTTGCFESASLLLNGQVLITGGVGDP